METKYSYLGGASEGLERARHRADAQAQRNAASLAGVPKPRRASLEERAQRWWDLPAKFEVANRISDEEHALHARQHNNSGDALRHAHWSRRTADAAGPIFSRAAGLAHEIDNLIFDRQPFAESTMDMINNNEGVRSSVQRRPLNPSAMQNAPISPAVAVRGGKYQ